MSPAIVQSLLVASAGMFSVGSILIVLLLLSTEQGVGKASGYVGGYLLTYVAVGLAVVATDPRRLLDLGRDFTLAAPFVKLALGAGFACSAVSRYFKRKHPPAASFSAFRNLGKIRSGHTFVLGALASVINVKNLTVFVYAAYLIASSHSGRLLSTSYLALMTLIFCSTVILPVFATAVAPAPAKIALTYVRERLERHGRATSILILGGFGALFLAQGFSGLARV